MARPGAVKPTPPTPSQVLIELKHLLERQQSPLLKYLMLYFKVLLVRVRCPFALSLFTAFTVCNYTFYKPSGRLQSRAERYPVRRRAAERRDQVRLGALSAEPETRRRGTRAHDEGRCHRAAAQLLSHAAARSLPRFSEPLPEPAGRARGHPHTQAAARALRPAPRTSKRADAACGVGQCSKRHARGRRAQHSSASLAEPKETAHTRGGSGRFAALAAQARATCCLERGACRGGLPAEKARSC
jgi:hypothetical protein